jgi:Glycosyl hydrolase family 62
MSRQILTLAAILGLLVVPVAVVAEGQPESQAGRLRNIETLLSGQFRWVATKPRVAPAERPEDPCHAIKDPSIVRYGDRWHLFCTIRSRHRTHQIEYLDFADRRDADRAERHVLKCTDGYFCAPQVFYFTRHRKWYVLSQIARPSRKPGIQPAFSTTTDFVVEAQGEGGRRYYKAYLADRLDGAWKPLAATAERPFAGAVNVRFDGERWTDSISHGELLRAGYDEHLEVDPAGLRFLFRGVSDELRRGKPYGEIPWRLGLLGGVGAVIGEPIASVSFLAGETAIRRSRRCSSCSSRPCTPPGRSAPCALRSQPTGIVPPCTRRGARRSRTSRRPAPRP